MNPRDSDDGSTKTPKLRIANAETKIVTSSSSKGRGFMVRTLSVMIETGEDNTTGAVELDLVGAGRGGKLVSGA